MTAKERIVAKLAGSKFFATFDETVQPNTVTISGQTQQLGGFVLIPATNLIGQVADLIEL